MKSKRPQPPAVIARVWRGWTEKGDDADEYEAFVTGTVFPDAAAAIPGLVDWEVLRREDDDNDRVEFATIARFESWDAVEAFAGEDYDRAHVSDEAEALLADYEETVAHYEVRG